MRLTGSLLDTSTAAKQTAYYCKRYWGLCTGANERGECNTTACWNSIAIAQKLQSEDGGRKMRLIDAEKAKEHILAVCLELEQGHVLLTTPEALSLAIEGIPTAEIEQGKWITDKRDPCVITCSICGEWIDKEAVGLTKLRYCPNCGAKMKEE